MRYFEIQSGIRLPASNEETELIEKVQENGHILNEDLNIREQEVARKLVSRGLLERKFIDHKMVFSFNGLDELYRK